MYHVHVNADVPKLLSICSVTFFSIMISKDKKKMSISVCNWLQSFIEKML